MKILSYQKAIREALDEEMARDERVFLLGQDVGAYGGAFAVTRGLFGKYGPERVRDAPIAETFIVGGGVGAALTGMRPVVELQYADFIAITMDEIYNKAAKWRYMHGGVFSVPLVIRAPEGAAGGSGPEHSQCPEHLLASASGLYVLTPATPADAKGLLKSAIRDDNPVVFFEHKRLYSQRGEIPDGDHLVPIGEAAVRRTGADLTVVAWSAMVDEALAAAETLAQRGVEADVIDPRGVRPIDYDTIEASVRKTGRLLIVHESPLIGGHGAEVAARVAENCFSSLRAPIRRLGAADVPLPQSAYLEKFTIPDRDSILKVAEQMVDGTDTTVGR
jgi:pyruvate/2-oxoglutarate/acetoin dehydrogenase E1 component